MYFHVKPCQTSRLCSSSYQAYNNSAKPKPCQHHRTTYTQLNLNCHTHINNSKHMDIKPYSHNHASQLLPTLAIYIYIQMYYDMIHSSLLAMHTCQPTNQVMTFPCIYIHEGWAIHNNNPRPNGIYHHINIAAYKSK